MKIEVTQDVSPALWECGGSARNTGDACIIASAKGEKKKAIYVRRRGSLSCASHALIPIVVGDVVVNADHHRKDFNIIVERIVALNIDEREATTEVVAIYEQGEWDKSLPVEFGNAVRVAREKATCYHCRSPHWIK